MKFVVMFLVVLFLGAHATCAQETTENCSIVSWHVKPYKDVERAIWYDLMCKDRGFGLLVTRGETKLNTKLLRQTVTLSEDPRNRPEVLLIFANGKKRKYQAGDKYAWAS